MADSEAAPSIDKALRNLELLIDWLERKPSAPASQGAQEATSENPKPKKPKRSTERNEARLKLIAALTKHHKYADGGCLKLEPIGNNELARMASVSKHSASKFFSDQFVSHAKYKTLCSDQNRLVTAIKTLNGEFRPRDYYGALTPDQLEQVD